MNSGDIWAGIKFALLIIAGSLAVAALLTFAPVVGWVLLGSAWLVWLVYVGASFKASDRQVKEQMAAFDERQAEWRKEYAWLYGDDEEN